MICPVCGESELKDDFDICRVCMWENDGLQFENPNYFGGANHLSLNSYKKWWNSLENIMPAISKKLNIRQSNEAKWKYDELIIPRENVKDFIDTMTHYGIAVYNSFYYLAKKYNYNYDTFCGYTWNFKKSVSENNQEQFDIIFAKDFVDICKKYNLKQVFEIIKNKKLKWEELTPHLTIAPNPQELVIF